MWVSARVRRFRAELAEYGAGNDVVYVMPQDPLDQVLTDQVREALIHPHDWVLVGVGGVAGAPVLESQPCSPTVAGMSIDALVAALELWPPDGPVTVRLGDPDGVLPAGVVVPAGLASGVGWPVVEFGTDPECPMLYVEQDRIPPRCTGSELAPLPRRTPGGGGRGWRRFLPAGVRASGSFRRAAGVAAAVGVLAVAGCTSTPMEPGAQTGATVEKVTYLTGFNVTGQDAFVYTAIERGFFRQVGLEVTVQPGKGTGQNLQLLAGGQAQFAVVDLTGAMIERGAGRQRGFTVFAAIYQRSVSCIMTMAGSGITTPKDLEGRTVGYQPGGVNHTLFPTYARLAGIDATKVRFVNTAPPQLRPLLVGGRLDAITEVVVGKPAVEAAAGRPVVVLPYSDVLRDLYGNALATSSTTAMGNPRIVTRFRDAMLRGLAYAMDHPDEAAGHLVAHQRQYKVSAAAAEIRQMLPYTHGAEVLGMLDPARVARSIAIIQGAGAIPDGLRPEDLIDIRLTPTATSSRSP